MSKKVEIRKGHRRIGDIPSDLLKRLNRGEEECISLVECLSIDFAMLMKHAFPKVHPRTIATMKKTELGWVGKTKLAGELLLKDLGLDVLDHATSHVSDQVRGWGAAMIAAHDKLPLKKRLSLVKKIADDPNPGVREVAWISLRPFIIADLDHSIELLLPWTEHKSANIRRFASEITRPRGVWCAHIPALRKNPQPALDILEPLKSDESRYVQNSVANWLNDASKDNAAWVKKITTRWSKESKTRQTDYIVRRALRSLNKQ